MHVSTYRRAGFLADLVACLERQTLAPDRFEVVIVDNGSGDDTWNELCRLVDRTPLRMAALRLHENRGPAAGRNAATSLTRGEVMAFTDDDCLPEPGWLDALLAVRDCDVVQGRTEPGPPGTATGAWDRTIRIAGPTPLFETCNIAYRRDAFERAGGFDEDSPISARAGGRAFGEDVLLGAAVVASGGQHGFAHEAVVHHRFLPGSYADRIRAMQDLAGFPALAGHSPVLRDAFTARWFLSPQTAAFDLAVVSVAAPRVRRHPQHALGALPWIRRTWPATKEHGGRPGAVRLAQLAVVDAAGAAALLRGSFRHRRLVL